MNILNVEIKAKCQNAAQIERILLANNAKFIGIDHQIDTYFNVSNGRLKLREGNIENHLIHYHRSNQEGPKASEVLLYKSDPTSNLKAILNNSLGIFVVVDKQRKIFFIDNVKFHIDNVTELGAFMEIEAIDTDGSIGQEKLEKQCAYFIKLLGIEEKDLVAVSYSDLLSRKNK